MSLYVSDDFLLEIGRIAVLQAHIEAGIALIIQNLAGVSETIGNALTKPLSFRNLAEISRGLLKLRAAELGEGATEAAEIIGEACKGEETRNKFVHSMWSFGRDFDPLRATRLKLSGTPPQMQVHDVSLDEIRRLAADMQQIYNRMVYIHPFLRVRS